MAYRTIHTKPDGKKYVYSVEGYWDKEKKQGRNRQTCLGRLDEKTGEIIPSNRNYRAAERVVHSSQVTATSKIIGPSLILDKISEELGLQKLLKSCFSNRSEHILSMAYFLVQKGLPLSRCETWSTSNRHPHDEPISSQRISELLKTINENERQEFFSKWMQQLAGKECLYYDITSISSYSVGNEYVRRGYNRDHENLPQVNLSVLFDQNSGLPGYYRRLPGSVSDVSVLKTTMKLLNFIEQTNLTFILDRGFYSIQNIDELFAARYGFVLAVPQRNWIEALYDEHRDKILSAWNRKEIEGGEPLYMLTCLHKWKERRCYVHIYFNNMKAAEEYDLLSLKLTRLMKELESGEENPEHEADYKRFFIVKETPKRGRKIIPVPGAEEAARKKYAGFFSIMTSKKMDAMEALEIYRRRETVENCFDDLKNQLDMKRLRIHSSETMDSRLFIQFIALILLSKLRQVIKDSDRLKNMTVREIMEAMETVTEVRFSGKYGKLVTEVAPLQRNIMNGFHVS